jgi:hypothetical protein
LANSGKEFTGEMQMKPAHQVEKRAEADYFQTSPHLFRQEKLLSGLISKEHVAIVRAVFASNFSVKFLS